MGNDERVEVDPTVLRPGGRQDPKTGLHEWYEETPELEVGRRIRTMREARGWSQEKLGQLLEQFGLGMRQTTVAKLESAGRPIRFNEVVALADVFGVDYSELYEQTPHAPTVKEQQALLAAIESTKHDLQAAMAELSSAEERAMAADAERDLVLSRVRRLRSELHTLEDRRESWDERRKAT